MPVGRMPLNKMLISIRDTKQNYAEQNEILSNDKKPNNI
jgi:hypothetical protein